MRNSRRINPIYDNTFHPHRKLFKGMFIIVLLMIIGGTLFWFLQKKEPNRPSSKRYPVMGVVIDATNGLVDMNKLQQKKVDFVYLKATQGKSYMDDQFLTQYDRSLGSGIALGVYHYFSFDTPGSEQADFFIKQVDQSVGKLPIAVKLTTYGKYSTQLPDAKKVQTQLSALINQLTTYYQREIIIWTTPKLEKALLQGQFQNKLWINKAGNTAPTESVYWQYTSENIDFKEIVQDVTPMVFNGDQKKWVAFKNN